MDVQVQQLQIAVEQIQLTGWICRPRLEDVSSVLGEQTLLILCHGIPRARPTLEAAENQADDGGYAALAEVCCRRGMPAFHFNFRGTGESEGDFDLSGWVRDLEAVLQYWQQQDPRLEFILWGFSGGAAVSAWVAARHPGVKGVILAACPATFEPLFPVEKRDEIIDWFRQVGIIRDPAFPRQPQEWLENIYRIKPAEAVPFIAPAPLLILHGAEDELIPSEQAEALFQLAGEPRAKAILPGAGHQLRKSPAAVEKALDWLQEMFSA